MVCIVVEWVVVIVVGVVVVVDEVDVVEVWLCDGLCVVVLLVSGISEGC